ncbi:MAG TPA: hypothetical protein VH062_00275 [Polyangiaceae bacterium]|nr:hypothetical protein [Polyangiaceae bacterium]
MNRTLVLEVRNSKHPHGLIAGDISPGLQVVKEQGESRNVQVEPRSLHRRYRTQRFELEVGDAHEPAFLKQVLQHPDELRQRRRSVLADSSRDIAIARPTLPTIHQH